MLCLTGPLIGGNNLNNLTVLLYIFCHLTSTIVDLKYKNAVSVVFVCV